MTIQTGGNRQGMRGGPRKIEELWGWAINHLYSACCGKRPDGMDRRRGTRRPAKGSESGPGGL